MTVVRKPGRDAEQGKVAFSFSKPLNSDCNSQP